MNGAVSDNRGDKRLVKVRDGLKEGRVLNWEQWVRESNGRAWSCKCLLCSIL